MSKPKIKLLSTDFDGTLFAEFDNPPVPHSLEKMIAELQSQGVLWVINTGRDMSSLMESMGRARLTIRPDYLVLVEREIHQLAGHVYSPLHSWNDRCKEVHTELFKKAQKRIEEAIEWIRSRYDATLYSDEYSPFALIAANNADADAIMHFVEEHCREIPELRLVRNDVYARMSHADFNKGSALGEVSKMAGISANEIFAAGDHYNDLPMLDPRWAKWLATTSNAVPVVKQVVASHGGHVSGKKCGEGIEEALRKWFVAEPV